MPINIALLKYGYTNFTLTILEICDKDSLMSREKHFFEVYSPEYNKNTWKPLSRIWMNTL